MHFKLLAPESGNFFRSEMTDYGVLTNPQNEGFELEEIDSEKLTPEERAGLYTNEDFAAVARAGNRYRIRQVFRSRRNTGAERFGIDTPALVTFENDEAVAVHPHQAADSYVTMRAKLTTRALRPREIRRYERQGRDNYNHRRPHSSIGDRPPISRVHNVRR